ncbi:MAG: HAMP domain-containing sensor histidine kinase [Desulfobulbus sp.]|nr:HAMP domain-containing sensor histidine kinase [Desulfobulbus sp.]
MYLQKSRQPSDKQEHPGESQPGGADAAPSAHRADESVQAGTALLESEKLKLVGSLAGALAHDFNNPLCGVRSVFERFTRVAGLADNEKHLLQLALQQCDRMKTQLQDLQDFVHASPGKRSRFDLLPTVAVVLRLMHKRLKLSQVVVHPLDEQEPIMVTGCEDQIKQMLLHLFAASCRGLAAGQCAITLKVLREKDWLRLLWRFEMPEGDGEQLEQFMADVIQPHPVLDSGLAMAHAIVRFHGGTVEQTGADQGCAVLLLSLPVEQDAP